MFGKCGSSEWKRKPCDCRLLCLKVVVRLRLLVTLLIALLLVALTTALPKSYMLSSFLTDCDQVQWSVDQAMWLAWSLPHIHATFGI